jgi:hypothetical protein
MFRAYSSLAAISLLASLWGCAASAPPVKPTALPKPNTAAPAPKAPKERLLATLRQVERPAPVLDLVPPDALAVLDSRLQALSAEQREQLLHGELAASMPLLHFKAGGSQALAFLALTGSPVAAQELPSAFDAVDNGSPAERLQRVQRVHDLAERAAKHFLRDCVLDLANAPASELPVLLDTIARVSRPAGRPDIERLALEAWVEAGASAEVLARLAVACAEELDEKCFKQARQSLPEASPARGQLDKLARAFERRNDGDPIVKGWALLHLGRYADARRAFAPVAAKSKADLRVASGLAVAIAEGSACPGLEPAAASSRLCSDANAVRPGLAAALGDLDAAWQAGGGRDAASSEAYLGLSHVVPWVSALAAATSPSALEHELSDRYVAMSKVLAELPEQKAFSVFVGAVSSGILAGLRTPRGERPQIDDNRKQELWFSALSVDSPAPRLAVAAVLASDQSIAQLVPASAPAELQPARAGLLVWEASSNKDANVAEQARAALAEQLSAAAKNSHDAALAVLLLAELDAHLQPGERSYGALAKVSSQLIGQALPPELALRGVLDAAGALERLGRSTDALGVLSKAAEIQSLPGPSADLLGLIRAEKLVLEWDAKKDPQRVALAKALAALDLANASPALAAAVAAWSGQKPPRGAKQTPRAALSARLGAPSAELLAKGTLRGTSVSMRVGYDFQTGLRPEVRFDPRLVPLVRADLIQKAL